MEDYDSLGTIIRHNNDDDNLDGVMDSLTTDYTSTTSNNNAFNSTTGIVIEGEDDLEQVRMLAGVESLAGTDFEIDVYFTLLESRINLWTNTTKGAWLLEGDTSSGRVSDNTALARLSSSNLIFNRSVYAESISDRYDQLSLYAQVYDSNDFSKGSAVDTVQFFPVTLNPYTPDTTYIDPMILPNSTWKEIGVGIRRNRIPKVNR